MALFSLSIQIISRGKGRSGTACSAYRSATVLYDHRQDCIHDYSGKRGVVYTEMMLPTNAPVEFEDRQEYWKSVELIEKSKDAQVAREIRIALQTEFSLDENKNVLREYIKENFVDMGMFADFSIHDNRDGNPHAHVLLSMRSIGENGNWLPKERKNYILDRNGEKIYDPKKKQYKTGKSIKTNDWDDLENAEKWRENWAKINNREFERKGIDERIDHRSHERRGLEFEPTKHLGETAHRLEQKGIKTEIGNQNREIEARNQERLAIKELEIETSKLDDEIRQIDNKLVTMKSMPIEECSHPAVLYDKEKGITSSVTPFEYEGSLPHKSSYSRNIAHDLVDFGASAEKMDIETDSMMVTAQQNFLSLGGKVVNVAGQTAEFVAKHGGELAENVFEHVMPTDTPGKAEEGEKPPQENESQENKLGLNHLEMVLPYDIEMKLRHIKSQKKDLADRSETITWFKTQIESMRQKIATLSPFDIKGRNELNDKIFQAEQSKSQAEKTLNRDYKIESYEIIEQLVKMEDETYRLERLAVPVNEVRAMERTETGHTREMPEIEKETPDMEREISMSRSR